MEVRCTAKFFECINFDLSIRVDDGQDDSHVHYQMIDLLPQFTAVYSLGEQFSIVGVEHNLMMYIKEIGNAWLDLKNNKEEQRTHHYSQL